MQDLEKWLVEWVALKTEKRVRQEEYERVSEEQLSRSVEADGAVRDFRQRMRKEVGIDPEVYWTVPRIAEPVSKD